MSCHLLSPYTIISIKIYIYIHTHYYLLHNNIPTHHLHLHTLKTHSSATTMAAPFIEPQCTIQPARRLKDFLQDQNLPFPRSRKSSISVFLHAAVKYSSIRTISRRFSTKNRSTSPLPEPTITRTTSVTVKDILRWKSFRDLSDPVEFHAPPVPDVSPESPRCTTSTGSPRSSSSCSRSWCDSDFTVGDSPECFRTFSGESEVVDKKNFHVNVASERKNRDLKDQIVLVENEEQQFSPISVLDFAQEHDEMFSQFHQTLADMERRNTMLKQQIHNFENLIDDVNKRVVVDVLDDTDSFVIEEKAIRLMEHVKTTSSIGEWDLSLDCLLLDYFRDELVTSKRVKNNEELESRVLNVAKSWVNGEDDGSLAWEMEGRREVCIREMDKELNWKCFDDDQNEIVIEIEKIMLNQLLDELSIDLVNV
ncbi:hypothetical protein HanRHA438_Chr06g0253981 [Helianthus annuus]|uniref:DUF4378 domain-containing protein n=2 Tax=Helianthus annuus TaxID=4232 RepID=A0A251UGL9_HELAN|nr:hypothetical protein HanXRQr2_Chr06g0244921 [Helianthus annuus]KAJ0572468.1 hypothetical protein HanHA89_Chr06g0216011 [Helianthus annuus]KAJ0910593.1 hypothetical protein HanRHA438_Chr06g0253981 [Helianthus annuus]